MKIWHSESEFPRGEGVEASPFQWFLPCPLGRHQPDCITASLKWGATPPYTSQGSHGFICSPWILWGDLSEENWAQRSLVESFLKPTLSLGTFSCVSALASPPGWIFLFPFKYTGSFSTLLPLPLLFDYSPSRQQEKDWMTNTVVSDTRAVSVWLANPGMEHSYTFFAYLLCDWEWSYREGFADSEIRTFKSEGAGGSNVMQYDGFQAHCILFIITDLFIRLLFILPNELSHGIW